MPRPIDADALTLKIDDWRVDLEETYGKNDEYVQCLESVLDMIEGAPTVAVAVVEKRKGKWIEYNATGKKQWMCSECCAEEKNPKVARFCYWCGADMRGDGNDN